MITIRRYKKSDFKNVAQLAKDTSLWLNTQNGSSLEAKRWFIDRLDPNKNPKIIQVFSKSPIFFVALANGKIVGMVRGRKDHLSNLYITKSFQGKGLGKRLLGKFEQQASKMRSKEVKVKSSLQAVPFYLKFNYKRTTGVRKYHGNKVQPMKKLI
mgnify:CR=1 FL=1